jgi:hypothetical protein
MAPGSSSARVAGLAEVYGPDARFGRCFRGRRSHRFPPPRVRHLIPTPDPREVGDRQPVLRASSPSDTPWIEGRASARNTSGPGRSRCAAFHSFSSRCRSRWRPAIRARAAASTGSIPADRSSPRCRGPDPRNADRSWAARAAASYSAPQVARSPTVGPPHQEHARERTLESRRRGRVCP